jgi:hypothetical protein
MKPIKRIIIVLIILLVLIAGDFLFKVYLTSLPKNLEIISRVTISPFAESGAGYDQNIPYKNGNAILTVIGSGDRKTLRVIDSNQNKYTKIALPKFNRVLFSSNGNCNENPQIIMLDDLFKLADSGALLNNSNYVYQLNIYKIIDEKIVLQETIESKLYSLPEQMNNEGVIVRVLDSDKLALKKHRLFVNFHYSGDTKIEQLDIDFKHYMSETPIILTHNYLIFQHPGQLNKEDYSVYNFRDKVIRNFTTNKMICINSIYGGRYDIHNDNVVWVDCVDHTTINLFNARSGESSQIATDEFKKSFLTMNDRYLLWVREEHDKDERSGIYGKDLKTGEEFLVAKNMWNVSKPILFHGYAYWSSIIPTMIADQRYVFRYKIDI